jgi:protein-S-isoprenylcysteine O-methyltransferase Ste14
MVTRLLKTALSREIVHMVCKVYIPVLFPLTFCIAVVALWLDGLLGWGGGFLPQGLRWPVAAGTLVLGTLLWVWTYAELVIQGKGSPSPTAGRTRSLVTTGIYAYSRNPSIFGKLLGVLSVGFALNSISFCGLLVPMLLAISLAEKVWRQEPQLEEVFGDEYVRYRREVPLFLPWGLLIRSRRVGNAKES